MPDTQDNILPELDFLIGLSPEKAIEFLKAKGTQFSWDWNEILKDAHTKAFTVAKVMKMDILQDIRDEVTKSLKEGITYEQFKRDLKPILKTKGWWGKVPAKDVPGFDPASGVDPEKIVQLGSPRRLDTIYRTNLRTSMAAGRWKEQQKQKNERPFLQYMQLQRPNKRESHARLYLKVFRVGDPVLDKIYPPNGWGCDCWMRSLSIADIKSGGYEITNGDTIDYVPDDEWNYNPGKETSFPNLNNYNYDVARNWVKVGLGKDFDAFMNKETEGNYPVAVLDREQQDLIGADSKVVLFSSESRDKNLDKHPEILLADYKKLPDLISEAELIIQDTDQTLLFIKRDNKIYYSAIKSTKDGKEIYLTSLRTTTEKDMNKTRNKGKVIRDKL